jgi:hypothetical protein
VVDLVKGRRALLRGLGILARHDFFDLARPADNGRFKSLDEILVSDGGVDVGNVLLGNVELGLALHEGGILGEGSHEFVQVGLELFLDTIGPLALGLQLGDKVICHLDEKVVKGVVVDLAGNNLILDRVHCNRVFARALDVKGHLVGLLFILKFEEFWRRIVAHFNFEFAVKPHEESDVVEVLQIVEKLLQLIVRKFVNFELVHLDELTDHPGDPLVLAVVDGSRCIFIIFSTFFFGLAGLIVITFRVGFLRFSLVIGGRLVDLVFSDGYWGLLFLFVHTYI